jgi:S1-C subfamily serine protease
MVQMTGQRGVPVITVDGQVIIGFDRPRLEQLLANGSGRKRTSFGLRVADADKIARRGNGSTPSGAYIGSVAPGSPAERAGLREGDIITEINTLSVKGSADVANALASLTEEGRVTIGFSRDGRHLKAVAAV